MLGIPDSSDGVRPPGSIAATPKPSMATIQFSPGEAADERQTKDRSAYLLDRLAIEDCVNRYARAVDRPRQRDMPVSSSPTRSTTTAISPATVPQFVTW